MGKQEISQFLSHLAVNRSVTASTQNQAPSALLYRLCPIGRIPLSHTGTANNQIQASYSYYGEAELIKSAVSQSRTAVTKESGQGTKPS